MSPGLERVLYSVAWVMMAALWTAALIGWEPVKDGLLEFSLGMIACNAMLRVNELERSRT